MKKTIIDKVFYIINSLVLILLIFSYISPFINPNVFWQISILGLLFPILVVINIIFLFYWTIRLKKSFFANLIILMIGLPYIARYIGKNIEIVDKKNYMTIKVMSYNIRMFNEYQWISEKNIKNNIIEFLNKENPDILCIQEFYSKEKLELLGLKYQHIGTKYKQNSSSIAIYSKYKQINKSKINIGTSNNTYIYSDIIINQDTIRIYNIHLASNWFKESDYSFINNPSFETSKLKSGILGIITRLKIAYKQRAKEVNIIQKHMKESPYPIILCGDFNDTPVSYAYQKLSKNLNDSFMFSGEKFGKTYIGIPTLRIDYILHHPRIKSTNFRTYEEIVFSDHLPISSEILLPIP